MSLGAVGQVRVLLVASERHGPQKAMEAALTAPTDTIRKHECFSAAPQFSQTRLRRPRARSLNGAGDQQR